MTQVYYVYVCLQCVLQYSAILYVTLSLVWLTVVLVVLVAVLVVVLGVLVAVLPGGHIGPHS